MVSESKEFSDRACGTALDRLAGLITTKADQNIIVFNPLARTRTDLVRLAVGIGFRFKLRDAVTGKDVPHQALPEGTIDFVAADVPSLGYKTFSLLPAAEQVERGLEPGPPSRSTLENQFYRIAFDPVTGAITSIRDKQINVELVDHGAPYKFNEYLYERYESPPIGRE